MGAPGSYYWTGTIKVYNLTSDSFYSPNKEDVDSHRYSYLGERLLLFGRIVANVKVSVRIYCNLVIVSRLRRDCRTLLLS